MVAASFGTAYGLTLAYEGGFVNHPRDPGGATNKGVTQRVYDAYRLTKGKPLRSVEFIEDAELSEIYVKQYWTPIHGDELPAGVDYAVYDFAVNSGVARAARTLQRIASTTIDGVIGFGTIAAVKRCVAKDEEGFIEKYCNARLEFMESLDTFATFGKGWTRRVVGAKLGFQDTDNGVVDYAIKLARADDEFVTPRRIGALTGEIAGKAF